MALHCACFSGHARAANLNKYPIDCWQSLAPLRGALFERMWLVGRPVAAQPATSLLYRSRQMMKMVKRKMLSVVQNILVYYVSLYVFKHSDSLFEMRQA